MNGTVPCASASPAAHGAASAHALPLGRGTAKGAHASAPPGFAALLNAASEASADSALTGGFDTSTDTTNHTGADDATQPRRITTDASTTDAAMSAVGPGMMLPWLATPAPVSAAPPAQGSATRAGIALRTSSTPPLDDHAARPSGKHHPTSETAASGEPEATDVPTIGNSPAVVAHPRAPEPPDAPSAGPRHGRADVPPVEAAVSARAEVTPARAAPERGAAASAPTPPTWTSTPALEGSRMPTAAASLPTDAPLPHAQAASQALDTALAWQLIPDAQTERAEVRFADRELDGLTVQVSVRGDQATVHFGSDNAEHRQIIQSSVHEVQALLNQRGLTLSEARVDPLGSGASVGAGGTGQREPAPPQTQPLVAVNGPADAHRSEPEPLMRAHARAVRGLDLFA